MDRPRKWHLNFVSFQQDLDQDIVDFMNCDFRCFFVPVRETCSQMIPEFCISQKSISHIQTPGWHKLKIAEGEEIVANV